MARSLCLLLTLALIACGSSSPEPENTASDTSTETPSDAASSITGIDVSSHQGDVDWAQVKASGQTFAFAKATQGNTYVDPMGQDNLTAARAAGLIVGAYHYYMTDDEPQSQFDNFSANATLLSGDLPPVVDIEAMAQNSLPDLQKNLQSFLEMLEKRYGVKPIIYSGENFANGNLTGFGAYPLWIAEYETSQPPAVPSGWTSWTFWQYSQSGSVAGVTGDVDLDRFNGDMSALKALLIP